MPPSTRFRLYSRKRSDSKGSKVRDEISMATAESLASLATDQRLLRLLEMSLNKGRIDRMGEG